MTTVIPPVKLVYYTSWFGNRKFDIDKDIGRDCPIPDGYVFNLTGQTTWCTLTSSTDHWQKASGLIFHAADIHYDAFPPRIDNQPRILETLESPITAPFRTNPEQMKNYDYLATYNFRSTFFFTYFSPSIMDVVNRPLPHDFMETKTKKAPILWIARNCRATSGRENYISELMNHIQVDSYGECLNNKEFPKDKSREELMAEYKFYLAIENANCEDYVTEKLYDTFMMSAVPIVDGPSSYEGYLPTNRSVIYMDAYPDPKDLADYINYLDKNDTAYLEYLSFRRDALKIAANDRLEPAFISNWSDTIAHKKRSDYCSICRGVLPWWKNRHTAGSDVYKDESERFLVDDSCQPGGKWNYISLGRPYNPSWEPRPLDEFTRPHAMLDEPVREDEKMIELIGNDTHTMAITANIAFICILLSFIIVLSRVSRTTSKQSITPVHV
ncbi:uncharacterized protein RHIMIDRAFT_311964 [Rhizopus microsporus ATCC 52813]|uniref:Fucosyltransferase n=1 Tax=Rhizopus microsporus ATCC 52813 TaxID=1340429 RepID=A0A2G4T245_RHIZD|nr:uncharacterized protein RHIMIDRAFT_311964 [Rhizopus microsporus ATCC 52813]PHZ14736.1 hypothetical protein RHIMIDRAFT_311964 [Rhizopus microsporus ATCC 52813]